MQNTNCDSCQLRVVCRCLNVTEEIIRDTVNALQLTTVREVRQLTGAGDGCTCCHRDIQEILDESVINAGAVACTAH